MTKTTGSQAADLLGIGKVPRDAVKSVGGYWQPKYSVPNARMVEAVQMLARTEGILLDPVCGIDVHDTQVAAVVDEELAIDEVYAEFADEQIVGGGHAQRDVRAAKLITIHGEAPRS